MIRRVSNFIFSILNPLKRLTRLIFTHGRGSPRGMTYVELLVALGIFSIMTSIVLFDYNKFQAKVDIKVLANDVALKIVEAQKASLSGKLPQRTLPNPWKPSYGIYLDTSTPEAKKNLVYFTDLDLSGVYNVSANCPGLSGSTDECLDKIVVTKGNSVSKVESYVVSPPQVNPITSPLSITFKRPGAGAVFRTSASPSPALSGFDYMQITVASPSLVEAGIKIYPSGRIQIN